VHHDLRLVATRSWPTGMVQVRYEVSGRQ